MKITVFTSNQPRHISLIESLSNIADKVFAIQECNTVFPGEVDDFFKKSAVMQQYFSNVINAEKEVFGSVRFLPDNVKSIAIKSGDLNRIENSLLDEALDSDYYIVFGSSFIKGELIDFLVENRAINIHMGLSPYYRGSSCNFWALHDDKPGYVGATIHMLSKGLDSGPMLFHAIPMAEKVTPFVLGMKAVRAAHAGLVNAIEDGSILKIKGVQQDKYLEIRYTKNIDFNDKVASLYLESSHSKGSVYSALLQRDSSVLLNPFIY